ncbi:hypothetical protein [Nocardia sp. NPDC052112]|uniref:tetratricopeptide repeat protein n=1 Tax=Nocardia sp. NPDC052112 TaxID=3155646 RepID=UPI003439DE66
MSPRSDLRSLFSPGRDGVDAQDVFANRHDEWRATTDSLLAHWAAVRAQGFSVEDFATPRRNVLVFYGVGGIGKTTLSKRLETHLRTGSESVGSEWGPVPAEVGRVLPIRIDLSRPGGVQFEDVILAMRLAVARVGHPMRAFDLALRRYWEVNHPGEPLEGYLRRNGFLRRAGDVTDLREQMRSVAEDVVQALTLPTVAGVAATTAVREIVRALRQRRSAVRALARCTRLADLLEADQDAETLSYFPHLLAWDLAQVPVDRSAVLVVLLDTFEEVGDRSHRDLERLFQRMVWLMPNALFIVTGRNRLQWDDPSLEGQLDQAGPFPWPQLAPAASADPRQHLVGFLSDDDRELYLRTRLTRNDEPVIPPQVRSEIASRSYGLPLFLDLAVMRFLDILNRTGTLPGPGEFDHDFPALVARIVRDLTPGERTVLRTVTLLDSFTVDLATAAAGLDSDASALNLVERPFVGNDPAAPWPYRLHDLIRSAVREADATSEDRWSPSDWRRAAQRTLDAVGTQMPAPGGYQHRRQLMACLTQGLRIACDFRLEPGWIVDAAWRYVIESVWEPIDIPDSRTRTDDEPDTACAAVALARVLHSVSRGQRAHRQDTADELEAVLSLGVLPESAEHIAHYFLGESLRHLGRYEASAEHMGHVAAGRSPMAGEARRGLAHIARHLGDFPTALNTIEALDHDTHYYRALGHLWWTQGDLALSCSTYGTARELALADHNPGHAALAQAGLAFAAALGDRTRADQQIELARSLLENVKQNWSETQVRTARLLRDAGSDAHVPARARELERDAAEAGLGSALAYIRFARCFHHALRAENDQLHEARDQLQLSVDHGEYAYLVEITHFFDGTEPDPDLRRANWIDGPDTVVARWQRLIAERRAALGYEPNTQPPQPS